MIQREWTRGWRVFVGDPRHRRRLFKQVRSRIERRRAKVALNAGLEVKKNAPVLGAWDVY